MSINIKHLKKVCFRIRRKYYDQIVKGEKKEELRKDTEFWRKRLLEYNPVIAVFVCGKDVHRRWITGFSEGKPETYLGRELSEQGKKDIPTEFCIATHLGGTFDQTNMVKS
jgi:hypothetical protein